MAEEYPVLLRCTGCGTKMRHNYVRDVPELLKCSECGSEFRNDEGYFDFLNRGELVFSGRREKMIRSLYAKVYTPVNNLLFLFCGGAGHARTEVLEQLELREGCVVLETGMGPGDNFLWMQKKAGDLKLNGIDIQKQMMVHCMRNIKKWGTDASIFRADAQNLPFGDNQFDVVFHLGAINLFPDKGRAIEEMVRVARPGTKIVIADETEKAAAFFNLFTGAKAKVIPPFDLIPESCNEKQMYSLWCSFGYLISFRKP